MLHRTGGSCGRGRQHRTSVSCNKYIIIRVPFGAYFCSWALTGTFVVLCCHACIRVQRKILSRSQMRALGHPRAPAPDKRHNWVQDVEKERRAEERGGEGRSRQGAEKDKIHVRALPLKPHIKSKQSPHEQTGPSIQPVICTQSLQTENKGRCQLRHCYKGVSQIKTQKRLAHWGYLAAVFYKEEQ